ncbi:DsrH/TusB family sulfur metabolism protein [Aquifex aeolicus]|uniref:DsrH/TusB family sulfur metabolism protein n=1 Tax=Aquifex aeolicus TaxID=63363 RepID=UPI00031077E7|nr:DsrH/TusB family sulfur metabolism protein [Aquifex aeolicus]
MGVKTLWLVRKLGDFSSDYLGEDDVVVLIQDGVLRYPSREGWYVCKEDAEARGLKFKEEVLISYKDIIKLIEEADKIVVW